MEKITKPMSGYLDQNILFKEVQQFRQKWLMLLLLAAMLVPVCILVVTAYKQPEESSKLFLSLLAVLVIEIPIFFLFYYSKLETIVVPEGLGYRWWPLQGKYRMIFKEDILDIWLRRSPAFTYGYHWLPGYGWVNNIRGRKGIQIKLKSGKRIYLGSQRIDELRTALEKVLNKRIGDFKNEF